MTEQELNQRIEKKQNDIAKIEKRITKWSTGMSDEAKSIASACELVYDDPKYHNAYLEYKKYSEEHQYDSEVFNQEDYNKGPQLDELQRAYRDLADAKATLSNYQSQLDTKKNFSNMDKIPAIWNFLQEWRKEARKFFIANAKDYIDLYKNEKQAKEEYLKVNNVLDADWRTRYNYEQQFREEYYANIHSMTKNIVTSLYLGKIDEQLLDKYLDKEVESKYKSLVARITEKAGEIEDASGLYIAGNGEINGLVKGTKNTVRVETITAGGYNIQILHYRVLVHIVK